MSILKRMLVGRPIASTEQEHQRIPKTIALAVFSSDAISSTAYATQEILLVVAYGGSSLALGLDKLVPIAIAVAVLLAIVAFSYRQTIFAYPNGGGSYVVSRENLGEFASQVAGASLMIDYVLTVAVSISAGTRAIIAIPAFNDWEPYRVEICVGLILILTVLNLRGVKEAGRIFAVPTYAYVAILGALIFFGLTKSYLGWFGGVEPIRFHSFTREQLDGLRQFGGTLTVFLLLKGFASGAVALTGVEAISNGVPAFRKNAQKNAAMTLVMMAAILGTLFFGVSVLAQQLRPVPLETGSTVFSQMGMAVFGNGFAFVFLQFATAAVLTLAANTSYAGFPWLTSIIARDGYLPRQLSNRGDRLVFSNGVLFLAASAIALVIIFGGSETALIPLYAVGVFTSFTLSQYGMVRFHRREREPKWRRNAVINGVGAVATFVVLLVVAGTKFTSGAWVSILVVAAIILLFRAIAKHYARIKTGLRVPADYEAPRMNHTVVVLVGNVHAGVLKSLAYAKSLHPNHILAVTVVSDDEEQARIERDWERYRIDIPLEIRPSPYRELIKPVVGYIDEVAARWPDTVITVVLPEFVVTHWWAHLLHNQTALRLKGRLLFRKNLVVTSVPYHVD